MKSKLVLWGSNAADERLLIALQLRASENKVDVWTVPDAVATEEFSQKLMNEWRSNNAEEVFPEGTTHIVRDLSIAGSLLPDDIKVEKGDLIHRAQSEWQFAVLSNKLSEAYRSELNMIEDKVSQLTAYSGELWDSLKQFWNKVQDQVKDRNLYREHADSLRDDANAMFDKLKEMRTSLNNEFESKSKSVYEQFNTTLETVDKKIQDGVRNFPALFDELKQTQIKFRDAKMTREHSAEIWNKLDGAFKKLKEKRFGSAGPDAANASAADRYTHRLDGLMGAVDKMQQSIDRDIEEIQFQKKRQSNAEGQLESQIRQAKINLIQDRIKSKEEKLNEMMATKAEIESKMKSQKERDAKRAAQEKAAAEIKAQSKSNNEKKQERKPVEAAPVAAEHPAEAAEAAPVETHHVEAATTALPVAAEAANYPELPMHEAAAEPVEHTTPLHSDGLTGPTNGIAAATAESVPTVSAPVAVEHAVLDGKSENGSADLREVAMDANAVAVAVEKV